MLVQCDQEWIVAPLEGAHGHIDGKAACWFAFCLVAIRELQLAVAVLVFTAEFDRPCVEA